MHVMKHVAGAVCLLGLFGTAVLPAGARTDVPDITGRQWAQSSKAEKLSFLYGASGVAAIEKAAAERAGREVSPFAGGWMDAFGNKTPAQIEAEIDAWYDRNPGNRDRHVFEVIWYELIGPETGCTR